MNWPGKGGCCCGHSGALSCPRPSITLWTRADSPLRIDTMKDLAQPAVRRIAIANPDHAPARHRQRARRCKTRAFLGTRLAQADPGRERAPDVAIRQTGDVNVAIVAISLSLQEQGRWVLVPEDLHAPIDQALAVVTGTRNRSAAPRLRRVHQTVPAGRPIMRHYGFVLPGEEVTP